MSLPNNADRLVITLYNLNEFKTKYDQYVAANYVPYSGATSAVDLGANNFTCHGVSILEPTSGVAQIAKDSGSGVLNISAGAGDITFYSHGHTYYLPGATGASDDYILATRADISSIYRPCGDATVAQLNGTAPSGNITNKSNGDVYNVTDSGTLTAGNVVVVAGDNVVWIVDEDTPSNSHWDKIGASVDLSNYYTKTQSDARYVPLSGGSTAPLTGTLYVQSGTTSNPSIRANGQYGALCFRAYGDITLYSEDGNIKFFDGSHNATFYFGSNSADRNYTLPNEDGTILVGGYATNAQIDALFS